MNNGVETRRLVELLYLRDRMIHQLRRSTSLSEVWGLYQDLKVLSLHIERLQNAR
ncbi:hypothetical protein [Candidatus Korobacter versatilis]|uniref:hypothetical protein n=1 Tax=Candidatus Korobacter versatilis TaxID=658062 RepID=UPI00031B6EDE|nr:hypothetical protein [Candidatus Koribacter versatilis]